MGSNGHFENEFELFIESNEFDLTEKELKKYGNAANQDPAKKFKPTVVLEDINIDPMSAFKATVDTKQDAESDEEDGDERRHKTRDSSQNNQDEDPVKTALVHAANSPGQVWRPTQPFVNSFSAAKRLQENNQPLFPWTLPAPSL